MVGVVADVIFGPSQENRKTHSTSLFIDNKATNKMAHPHRRNNQNSDTSALKNCSSSRTFSAPLQLLLPPRSTTKMVITYIINVITVIFYPLGSLWSYLYMIIITYLYCYTAP